jgi:hypothetical protein
VGPIYVFPAYSLDSAFFRSVTKAPKPASIVLVSLLYAIPFGWCLHDGVVAPYHHQHYGNLWKAN